MMSVAITERHRFGGRVAADFADARTKSVAELPFLAAR